MAPGALFAVHSWRDQAGREPDDFPSEAPENRLYLDYYAEMGMTPGEARAFYALTNSVPHAEALWLQGTEMARWIAPGQAEPQRRATSRHVPVLATAHAHRTNQQPFVAATKLARPDLRPMTLALLDSAPAFP